MQSRGFTLIECTLSIVLLGLAAMVLVTVTGTSKYQVFSTENRIQSHYKIEGCFAAIDALDTLDNLSTAKPQQCDGLTVTTESATKYKLTKDGITETKEDNTAVLVLVNDGTMSGKKYYAK